MLAKSSIEKGRLAISVPRVHICAVLDEQLDHLRPRHHTGLSSLRLPIGCSRHGLYTVRIAWVDDANYSVQVPGTSGMSRHVLESYRWPGRAHLSSNAQPHVRVQPGQPRLAALVGHHNRVVGVLLHWTHMHVGCTLRGTLPPGSMPHSLPAGKRTSAWPLSAAQCSGVQPSGASRSSTRAPAASAAATPATSPSLARVCRPPCPCGRSKHADIYKKVRCVAPI